MRYFKLINSDGDELDITTNEIFLHSIEGLGFEEDNAFNRIGSMWALISSNTRHKVISGKVCFTDENDTTPYQKFFEFAKFIAKAPLVLNYRPDDTKPEKYNRIVRVSKLEKTEIKKYGALDEKIEFEVYTPWYLIETKRTGTVEEDDDSGWIWDRGNHWRDDEYGTLPEGSYKYKFGGETLPFVTYECEQEGPVKLTIFGPATNPSWTQLLNDTVYASGGFDSETPINLSNDERLIIDSTGPIYTMKIYNSTLDAYRDVYRYRDFDKACFFKLRPGSNKIKAAGSDNAPLNIETEGYIYYATV